MNSDIKGIYIDFLVCGARLKNNQLIYDFGFYYIGHLSHDQIYIKYGINK